MKISRLNSVTLETLSLGAKSEYTIRIYGAHHNGKITKVKIVCSESFAKERAIVFAKWLGSDFFDVTCEETGKISIARFEDVCKYSWIDF